MTASAGVAAVVLAAGRGTRMHSPLPKVLHEAAGAPILAHVLAAVSAAAPARTVVIVGHGAAEVRRRFARSAVEFAHQAEQLGTGHALAAARPALGAWGGTTLVVNGDDVLLEGAAVAAIVREQQRGGAGMTLLTYEVAEPAGLGRVVRGGDGGVVGIVEERDADAATRAIREVNPGCYAFDAHVWDLLDSLGSANAAGEYYLTDLVGRYVDAGLPVRAVRGERECDGPIGVNDRAQLALADRLLRRRR